MQDKVIYPDLSYRIVGIVFSVFNDLGYGYQEKYYQRALSVRLREQNIVFKEQVYCPLMYQGKKIGSYFFDFLIEDKIVLELKRADYFSKSAIDQVYAYLKARQLQLGIIVIFTSKGVKFKRVLNVY